MALSGKRATWASILGVVSVAGILIGANMVVDTRLAGAQLDLTQGHVYTLSAGTRSVLKNLKEPVTLNFYYSPLLGTKVPQYGAYAERVREMLTQYARISHGKVKLHFYDPEPFSDTEDSAVSNGLQGVPIDQSGEQVFFGLVGTNLLDSQRSIAFFQPDREQFLEYDLTRIVMGLSNAKKPVLGLISNLPWTGDMRAMMRGETDAGPWESLQMLKQSYTLKPLGEDFSSVPPDVHVLLVAQAQNLSEATKYAIDQFVMRGGRLMLMLDPDSEAQAAKPGPVGQKTPVVSSDLHELLDAWGISYDPEQVVADLDGAWHVRAPEGDQLSVVAYPAWFNDRDGINHNDPATADLSQVTVASAGAISKKKGADITLTPLLSSSADSEMIPAVETRTMPNPSQILANFHPDGHRHIIVARVHGMLHSAFKEAPKGIKAPPYIAETTKPANIVIAADTDILSDRFWIHKSQFYGQEDAQPFSDNGPFVANIIGTLAGGDVLMGLRGRGVANRPFTVVEAMNQRAQAQFRHTEKMLQAHLDDTERKLSELRRGDAATAAGAKGPQPAIDQAVFTPAQQQAISAAEHEIVTTRKQLRNVERDLKHDISALEMQLRIFDIVLVPAILAILAIGLGIARRRRRALARA